MRTDTVRTSASVMFRGGFAHHNLLQRAALRESQAGKTADEILAKRNRLSARKEVTREGQRQHKAADNKEKAHPAVAVPNDPKEARVARLYGNDPAAAERKFQGQVKKKSGDREKTKSVNLGDKSSVAPDPANAFEKHKVFVVYN
jgi:hypothetical protein